jgi:hypothetical protein
MKKQSIILTLAVVAIAFTATSAQAAVILADDFADRSLAGNTATFGSWNTVDGIDTPAASLSFDKGGTTTAASFFGVNPGEIDVNNNMTADGWDTSFVLDLDASTASIALTSMVIDIRLTNGSGGAQTTGSKSGRMVVELVGSSSGSLGTVDPGNSGYPTVEYTRTLDLTGLPTLDGSETYTIILKARGTGYGHHKSLQAFELSGDITPIPEPATMSLLALGGLAMLRRRRRA